MVCAARGPRRKAFLPMIYLYSSLRKRVLKIVARGVLALCHVTGLLFFLVLRGRDGLVGRRGGLCIRLSLVGRGIRLLLLPLDLRLLTVVLLCSGRDGGVQGVLRLFDGSGLRGLLLLHRRDYVLPHRHLLRVAVLRSLQLRLSFRLRRLHLLIVRVGEGLRLSREVRDLGRFLLLVVRCLCRGVLCFGGAVSCDVSLLPLRSGGCDGGRLDFVDVTGLGRGDHRFLVLRGVVCHLRRGRRVRVLGRGVLHGELVLRKPIPGVGLAELNADAAHLCCLPVRDLHHRRGVLRAG